MSRRLLILIVLPMVFGLGRCARALPPVGLASGQTPVAGSPAIAWHDVAGRCTVSTASVRISCRAVVRRDATGGVRLALLADEGVLLCDVAVNHGQVTVYREVPDLVGRGEGLGQLSWQAWGGSAIDSVGTWHGGAWRVDDGVRQRWFAGDPLVLRRIDGPGPQSEIGDYRPWSQGLLAYQAQLSGAGFTVNLQLNRPVADDGPKTQTSADHPKSP